jgi:predicted DNA binding CopG/RHH family protein
VTDKELEVYRDRLKKVPKFNTEEDERDFWASHDATDYLDFSQAEETVFPNLKPSTRSISLRLPVSLIDRLKMLDNKKDVPYQSLLKVLLAENLTKSCITRNNMNDYDTLLHSVSAIAEQIQELQAVAVDNNEKLAPLVRASGKTLNSVERTSQTVLIPSNSRELKPNQGEQVVPK